MENDRRKQIELHLVEGLAGKLRDVDPDHTLTHLRKAYRLATHPFPLVGPWPFITAYRLAHFQMRQAQTHAELEEINELLEECCSPSAPIEIRLPALIFRLPVLHRLGAPLPEQKRIFEQALLLKPKAPGIQDFKVRKLARQVQDPVTNLLELSAYFTGFDLGPLKSSGILTSILPELPGDIWHIAGTHGLSSDLVYTSAIAEDVLNAWVASNEVDIAFRLEKKGRTTSGIMLSPTVPRGAIPDKAFGHMALACISQDHEIWQKHRGASDSNVSDDVYEVRNALGKFFPEIGKMLLASPRRDGVYCFQSELRVAVMAPDELFRNLQAGEI